MTILFPDFTYDEFVKNIKCIILYIIKFGNFLQVTWHCVQAYSFFRYQWSKKHFETVFK